MILVMAMFDDDDDKCDFHHIIHLVNIIGVTKFGGSKEVNNFETHNKKVINNLFKTGYIC